MTIGILKEPLGENRVSMLPEQVGKWIGSHVNVLVESDAGRAAYAYNQAYEAAGAQVASRSEVLQQSDIVLQIQLPGPADIQLLRPGTVMLGIYQPLYHFDALRVWANSKITTFSMDMIPRTTRAQSMDVLSSQANIAGYRAVVVAAGLYPRYLPMLMTAAGSIAPAKMLVLGAGVAGLQAIATGRRLGAVVEVFDTRPAVKEEVMSLGARFIEVEGAADATAAGGYAVEQSEAYKQQQQQKIADALAKADIVITTAQIPGKKAPLLITEAMLEAMRPGTVIVDLAAATGGNTPFTENNKTIVYKQLTIVGDSNLASGMPADASKLYGKNISNFLALLLDGAGNLHLNWNDDLVKGTCITFNGDVVNERVNGMIQQQ